MKTKNIFRFFIITVTLMLSINILKAQDADLILSSIKKEVDRSKTELKIDNLQPPFFIGYTLIDSKHMSVNASLGSLLESTQYSRRNGFSELLTGSYERNNLGYIDMNSLRQRAYSESVCLEDDPAGIAFAIWRDMDGKYKNAAEKYEAKVSIIRQQNLSEEDLAVVDFEKVEPVNIMLKPVEVSQDLKYWENYIKKSSESLKKFPALTKSNISIYSRNTMLYYYSSDNSKYAIPVPYCRLHLHVEAMTKDGQELYDDMYFEYGSIKMLPSLDNFTKDCEAFVSNFIKLIDAPMIDDAYSGPVLFEEQAAVEIVQEMFMNQQSIWAKAKPVVHDMVRQYYGTMDMLESNRMEMMMNKKIISRSLSLKAITGIQNYNDIQLEGYYPVDFEGVAPEKEIILVENGVLKSMLNRRTPTKKIPGSNGHYRFNFNSMNPHIAPGNVLLTSNDTYSKEELKKKLLDMAKEEDLEYAYIIRKIWQSNVIMLYKIYVEDGREEIVRGAKLEGFNLKSFKRISGAASQNYVRHTANYGSLATYIVPDGLLFEELEITRDGGMTLKTPFLVPQPTAAINSSATTYK